MVRFSARLAACIVLASGPVLAQGPWETMFPSLTHCYARSYSAAHLAEHPVQRVTDISLSPDGRNLGPGELRLMLKLSLRGSGEVLEATAYCEAAGPAKLYCGIEGDGGGFELTPAKDGAVTLAVSRNGMAFEGMTDFIQLEHDRGDDRVFLLPRAKVCG